MLVNHRSSANDDDILMLIPASADDVDFALHFIGHIQVVMGQPRKPFTPHLVDPVIQRRRATAVFLMEIAHLIPVGEGNPLGCSIVCGAVIDDDDLNILIGLGQRGINGLFQKVAAIVYRYDDGNQWSILFYHMIHLRAFP